MSGLAVGDDVELVVITESDAASFDELTTGEDELMARVVAGDLGTRVRFTLVGTGIRTSDVVPGAALPSLYVTRAFVESLQPYGFYGGIGVRLVDGADGIEDF